MIVLGCTWTAAYIRRIYRITDYERIKCDLRFWLCSRRGHKMHCSKYLLESSTNMLALLLLTACCHLGYPTGDIAGMSLSLQLKESEHMICCCAICRMVCAPDATCWNLLNQERARNCERNFKVLPVSWSRRNLRGGYLVSLCPSDCDTLQSCSNVLVAHETPEVGCKPGELQPLSFVQNLKTPSVEYRRRKSDCQQQSPESKLRRPSGLKRRSF